MKKLVTAMNKIMIRKLTIVPAILGITAMIISACSAGGGGGGGGNESTNNSPTASTPANNYTYSGNSKADFVVGKWSKGIELDADLNVTKWQRITIDTFVAREGSYYKFMGTFTTDDSGTALEGQPITIIYNSIDDRFVMITPTSLGMVVSSTFMNENEMNPNNSKYDSHKKISGCERTEFTSWSVAEYFRNPDESAITSRDLSAYSAYKISMFEYFSNLLGYSYPMCSPLNTYDLDYYTSYD